MKHANHNHIWKVCGVDIPKNLILVECYCTARGTVSKPTSLEWKAAREVRGGLFNRYTWSQTHRVIPTTKEEKK